MIIERLRDLVSEALDRSLVRFMIVGSGGFAINYVALFLFFDILNLPIWLSQIFGAEISLIATFFGNNFWSYKGHEQRSLMGKFVKFQVTATIGLIINTACVTIAVSHMGLHYGIALALGTFAGLIWNHNANKNIVFKAKAQA